MSDVNVTIEAIDKAMDMMDTYAAEIEDLLAHVKFDIHSLIDDLERERRILESQIEDLRYSDSSTEESEYKKRLLIDKLEELQSLIRQTSKEGERLKQEWEDLCIRSIQTTKDANHVMGEYIRKLNLSGLYNQQPVHSPNSGNGSPGYHVIVIDSEKYPQTAEHIKRALKMGLPEIVTIERTMAATRRKQSLSEVRARSIYDRDEWPMAVFSEGGDGANVIYVAGSDNRGAGASISWQMRNLPNGTRVRIRVI